MPRAAILVVVLGLLAAASAAAAAPVLVSKQSPSRGGAAGDGDSGNVSLSRDGRFAAFVSDARNLSDADVEDSINPHVGREDVFVHDRMTGETVLASPPGPLSFAAAIAADGRSVAFVSDPHSGDEPSVVHLRDLTTGALRVLGRDSTTYGYAYPQAPPAISGNGQIVAFETHGRAGTALRAFDRRTGRTRTVAPVERSRFSGLSISLNGGFVAYSVLRKARGGDRVSVYRYDLRRHRRRLVARYLAPCCLISYGVYGTALSGTGRHLAYVSSRGDNRGEQFGYRPRISALDARTGRRRTVSVGAPSGVDPSISGDGRFVSFTQTRGGVLKVRDLKRGVTRRVGGGGGARLSADGRWLGFSGGTRLPVQAFVVSRP